MSRRGWLLFATLGVCWGIPYLFIRIAVTDLDPLIVAFGRTAIGALLLLPLALRARASATPAVALEAVTALHRDRDRRSLGAAGARRDQADQLGDRAADCRRADRRGHRLDDHRRGSARTEADHRPAPRLRRGRPAGRLGLPGGRPDRRCSIAAGGHRLRGRPDHRQPSPVVAALARCRHRVAADRRGRLRARSRSSSGRIGSPHRPWARSWCWPRCARRSLSW